MSEFRICVPSKGRAGSCETMTIFKNAFVYVSESEYQQYKMYYKNVIKVPNEVQGITKTRNWILKNTKQNVFFIDDDLLYGGFIERTDEKYKVKRVTEEQIYIDEIKKLFEVAYQSKSKLIGLFTVGNNLTNYSYNPFLFNGVCMGSCMGVINDGEYYFDETYEVKEDYELTLRHLKEKGLTVRSNILFMQHEHTQKEGGCRDFRRIEKEKKAIKKLIKAYPNAIKSAKHRGTSFAIQLNI